MRSIKSSHDECWLQPLCTKQFPTGPCSLSVLFPLPAAWLSAVLSPPREREGQGGEATAPMDVWAADPVPNPLTHLLLTQHRQHCELCPLCSGKQPKPSTANQGKGKCLAQTVTTQRHRFAVSHSPGIALSWFHLRLSELRRSKPTREAANAEVSGALYSPEEQTPPPTTETGGTNSQMYQALAGCW